MREVLNDQAPVGAGISVDANELYNAARLVSLCVPRRVSYPLLNHIRLTAANGRLRLQATDLECSIEHFIACGAGELDLCIPAHTLNHIPAGYEIRISEQGQYYATINNDIFRVEVPALPADEFPEFPVIDPTFEATLTQDDLAEMMALLPFCSKDASRSILCGILFDGSVIVATDTHRPSVSKIGADNVPTAVWPCGAINKIRSMRHRLKAESIHLRSNSSSAEIGIGDTRFTFRFTEGKFPDYTRVLPSNIGAIAKVSSRDMNRALALINNVLSGSSGERRVSIRPEDGRMLIHASYADYDVSYRIDADVSGELLPQGFKSQYLRDVMNFLPGDDLEWSQQPEGETKAVMMRKDKRIHMLMPMHLD